MELYHIALHEVDRTMRRQFGEPETHDHPERATVHAARPTRTMRLRVWLSTGLYGLANALDPTLAAPRGASHQP